MELNEHGFLEEFFPMNELFFTNGCNFDFIQPNTQTTTILPFSDEFSFPFQQNLTSTFNEVYNPFSDGNSFPHFTDSSSLQAPFEDFPMFGDDEVHTLEMQLQATCKMEAMQSPEAPVFNVGACLDRKNQASKKLEGQPSKNLMAERRRRKRLNDRLSMLRSIVPKISKMDRTSILGDTIDYMKELLERINNLQQEGEIGTNNLNAMGLFKPNVMLVRNSPKFEVERRNMDTHIEICCAGKSGLLLSTVNTLEALGLEIQHCVISCFNDFALQASCSQELEGREEVSSEDIKQELFRNAGYAGKCP